MPPDDQSGARPAGPVVLRIKLRYDDLDTMVLKFASNVGKSGLFLPTKSIQPIGTEVKFELRLSNDTPVLVGLGRVKHVRPPDPANPKAAFGMAIELMRVSREGREVIIRMIERRRALGLPEVAIPFPEDLDAARRSEVGSQPRVDTSGIVRDAMRDFATAPVAEQVLSAPVSAPIAAPVPAPAPTARESAPVVASAPPVRESVVASAPPVRESAPVVVRESASLLTAPRQGSGPIPMAASDAASGRRSVAALAPEAPKPKRPRAADLLAKANDLAGMLSAVEVPGLDAQVDVERALVRARALAGTDLDRELAALGEDAAAPHEISIEAASAELARQLGGKAISKRDRSLKADSAVSVPTSVVIAPPPEADSFVTKTRAPTEASPAAMIAAVTTQVTTLVEPAPPAAVEPPPIEPAPIEPASLTAAPIVPADEPAEDAAAEYAVDDKTRIPSGEDYENAFLPSASTSTAIDPEDALEIPVENAPARSFASVSEDQLRTHPGEDLRRMLIDDAADEGMLRRALEGSSPAMKLDESDLEEVADDEDHGESTHIGALPIGFPHAPEDLSARLDRELAEADAEADADFREMAAVAAPIASRGIQVAADPESYEEEAVAPEGGEEISDLDVLAEADAGDADLLHAHAEREALPYEPVYADPQEAYAEREAEAEPETYAEEPAPPLYAEPQAYAQPPDDRPHYSNHNEAAAPVFPDEVPGYVEPLRPSQEDFAARLDLDDEPDDEEERRNFPSANPRPRSRAESYSIPPAASDFHDPPSESYTFAEPFPQTANLGFAPHPAPAGEDFDEPHGFTQNTPVPASRGASSRAPAFEQPARARSASRMPQPVPDPDDQIGRALQSFDEPSQPQPPTEDLEDALAALDVDLDPQVQEQRRVRRQTGSQRPLPGLPLQRETGPSPVVSPPRTRSTGANVIQRNPATQKSPTMPPPIPVGARKSGTTPPPMPVAAPPKRATTDDGIMIDFDDDE